MPQPKVMIVDDDANSRAVLCDVLGGEPYTLLEAANGQQALELANKELPDLILLDIMMPNMDGFEVIRRMKKSENLRLIPIIVITAKTNFLEENEALEKDIAGYVIKPFEVGPLLAKINKTLSGGKPSAE